MKRSLFLVFCFFMFSVSVWSKTAPKDSITVYLFLNNDCVICQSYTLTLSELYNAYAQDDLQFVGVFPEFSSKPEDIEAFKETYHLQFPLITDYSKTLTQQLGATVTPEVVVFDHSQNKALYQGRIDNSFFRVGKRRTITTTSELKDVLEAIRQGQPILTSNAPAVGCFISQKKPF